MYYPINNQQFWILWFQWTGWRDKWFQWTGWRDKWFRQTGWHKELVEKQFRGTGWFHKWFQGIGWHRKRSKKRSKQWSKCIYLHYQQKFTQKLLISLFVPKIISATIRPVDQLVTEDSPVIREILGSHQTVLPNANVTDAANSGARIFLALRKVSRTGKEGSTSRVVNSAKENARFNPPSPSSNPNYISPMRTATWD